MTTLYSKVDGEVMSSVGIRDLKANLSAYLQTVRNGQEIIVLDHKVPIAKIVPIDPVAEPESEELELVAAGILRLPVESLPSDFWDDASLEISPEKLIQAISEDRDDTHRLLG